MSEYKVGDFVVFKDKSKFKNNLLKIVFIQLGKVMDIKTGLNGYVDLKNIRLATPKEIEQGFRDE